MNSALSPAEMALLRAACLRGPDALAAFATWRAATDLDRLPHRQMELLPLAARNLEGQGIDDPGLTRMMGIYRRSWYANQLALHALRGVLDVFAEASVPTRAGLLSGYPRRNG